jgi:hypothetical protein
MDTFFNYLRKGLLSSILLIFSFVVIYAPYQVANHNSVPEAEASWPTWDAGNIIQTTKNFLANTARWAIDMVMEWKEMIGEGIGWAFAKAMISQMIKELTNWVNSGFQGRPMFVEDLGGFMLETADRVAGEYLEELGGINSFLCSPFKLDIRAALATDYANKRDGPVTCSLTGIIDNLEGFVDGTQGSFSKGGWDSWLTMAAQPSTYSAYGQYLEAKSYGEIQIINAKGEVQQELDYGKGFFSAKECETYDGGGFQETVCSIVSPGSTIASALNKAIDAPIDTLIAADDINNLVGALINQAANKVFTGAGGLLGS